MAAAEERSGNSRIFWMNVSDDEQPLVFIPGVDGEVKAQTPFNLRPFNASTSNRRTSKMGMKRSSDYQKQTTKKMETKKQNHSQNDHSGAYTKESVHHNAAVMTAQSLSSDTLMSFSQVISDTKAKSEVCLKDLCPEDKRRIANLIEELARVNEEKEESVQRLKDEQGNFECKIKQLEQQNLIIAQEREHLQQQYRECQELLGLYQQYLSQQQAKLNQSIAQLSQPSSHGKVHSSEKVPSRTSTSRANGFLFDGSYLSLAATGAQQPQAYRNGDARRGEAETTSSVGVLSSTYGVVKQHMDHKRECRGPYSCHRYEQCECSDHGTVHGTQQQRADNGPHLMTDFHNTFIQDECKGLHGGEIVGSDVKEVLTRPLLGHEDWEERRHQLLLQKMQLELERERLQTRLAEQEERLQRQNQQLRKSQLDYSRVQQATQAELSSSDSRNGGTEVHSHSHQNLPSSVLGNPEVHPAGQSLHEKPSQTVPDSQDSGSDPFKRSTKDMATSPAKTPIGLSKPTSVSVIQQTPEARLDFSLVELLDILSPVSAPKRCKSTTRRSRALQHRPAPAAPKSLGRTLLTTGGPRHQSTEQDLEESQILEDIFFIC